MIVPKTCKRLSAARSEQPPAITAVHVKLRKVNVRLREKQHKTDASALGFESPFTHSLVSELTFVRFSRM